MPVLDVLDDFFGDQALVDPVLLSPTVEARRTQEFRTVSFCFPQARIVICNRSVIRE